MDKTKQHAEVVWGDYYFGESARREREAAAAQREREAAAARREREVEAARAPRKKHVPDAQAWRRVGRPWWQR